MTNDVIFLQSRQAAPFRKTLRIWWLVIPLFIVVAELIVIALMFILCSLAGGVPYLLQLPSTISWMPALHTVKTMWCDIVISLGSAVSGLRE